LPRYRSYVGVHPCGDGIFLSSLLIFLGWAETRQASGVSAAFTLVNSEAGLLGHTSGVAILPSPLPIWAVAAVGSGWLGAEYGAKRLGAEALRVPLSLVPMIAGLKMILL